MKKYYYILLSVTLFIAYNCLSEGLQYDMPDPGRKVVKIQSGDKEYKKLIASLPKQNIPPTKSLTPEARKIKDELELFVKKDHSRLTATEIKKIRSLLNQLKKLDPDWPQIIWTNLTRTNCAGLSAFEEREIEVTLDDLLKKPNIKDANWGKKIEQLLSQLFKSINANFTSCAQDKSAKNKQVLLDRYTVRKNKYEKIIGKKIVNK
jgi:hypothetical protein